MLTICLNLFPLSSKFLNISKLALAGENNTISPFFASFFAATTASSNVWTFIIFKLLSGLNCNSSVTAWYILSAVWPSNISVFTLSIIGFAIGL